MPRGVRKQVAQASRVAVVQKRSAPSLEYEPELVMVRALRRGQYGVQTVVDKKWKDDQGRVHVDQELGRDAVIHNEGEVFEMDTADMRKWPLSQYGVYTEDDTAVREGIRRVGSPKEMPHDNPEIIEVNGKQYELPSWVTYAGDEYVSEAAGHAKTFGNLGALTGANAS